MKAPVLTPTKPADVEQTVKELYGHLSFLLSDIEVGAILRQAAAEGWDDLRLEGALKSTTWYRTHSDATRSWTEQERNDPATARRRIDSQRAVIANEADRYGLVFDDARLTEMARASLMFGWTGVEIGRAIRDEVRRSGDSEPTRRWDQLQREDPATAAQQVTERTAEVKATAKRIGFAIDDAAAATLAADSLRGGWGQALIEAALTDQLRSQTAPEATRRWDDLQATDPATAQNEVARRTAEVRAMALRSGLDLDAAKAERIATESLRGGWNQAQIDAVLADEVRVSSNPESVRQWDLLVRNDNQTAQARIMERTFDVQAAAQRFGLYIDEARLAQIAEESLRGGWSATRVDAVLQAELANQPLSRTQREYELLRRTDPKSADQLVGDATARIKRLALQKGVGMADERAAEIAELAVRNGWDQGQVEAAVAAEFSYAPGAVKGDAAGVSLRLKRLAKRYGVPLTDATLGEWVGRVIKGEDTEEGFTASMVAQAKGLYGNLAGGKIGEFLDKGQTLEDYAEPYRQFAANLLEMNPNDIDFTSENWMGLLNVGDLPTLGTHLRTAPGFREKFDKTSRAREQSADLQTALLEKLGRLA